MKLVILGCHSPFPAANGATSGYLLQTELGNVLIECGSGVLSQLHRYIPSYNLDAVVVSHSHADHIADLNVLKYAIDVPNLRGLANKELTFFGPEEHSDDLKRYTYKNSLQFKSISVDDQLQIAGLNITFCKTVHTVPCYAMKIACNNKTIVYTADTEYTEEILKFSMGADLLITEATMLNRDFKENAGHLSAKLAATLASNANVKHLLLTHLWPYYDSNDYLEEAMQYFSGYISIAATGQEYNVE